MTDKHRENLCPSSGETIPGDGCVQCVCGRQWWPRGARGRILFRVPVHTTAGHVIPEARFARQVREALDTWLRRQEMRRELEARRMLR